MKPPALIVLIADDHAIFRRGVREILVESFAGITVLEAESARQTLDIIRQNELDAVLLDITLPDRSGLEILADIKNASRTPVLILSAHSEDQYAIRVLKAGASGYVAKDEAPRELIEAMQKILAGGKYITATLAEKLAAELTGETAGTPHQKLSEREMQILQRLSAGKSIKEISADLCIAAQTVSTHRARLLKKMALQTNADLIRYAIENKLI